MRREGTISGGGKEPKTEKITKDTVRKNRRRGLNGTALKWIAVLTMLIDHTTVCFLERTQGPNGWMLASSSELWYRLDRVGRAVGRQAFPIFAFFIVEGYCHTRSRGKYLARLSAFAVISELPFWLLNYTGPIGSQLTRSVNVYATLALGLLAVWIVDAVCFSGRGNHRNRQLSSEKRPVSTVEKGERSCSQEKTRETHDSTGAAQLWVRRMRRILLSALAVGGICLLAYWLNTDYDYIGILTIVIFYLFHQLRLWAYRRSQEETRRGDYQSADAFGRLAGQMPLAGSLTAWVWMGANNEYEWFALPAFLLLALCYNGERGGSVRHRAAEKYFFYAFYPAHLLILWGVRRILFGY